FAYLHLPYDDHKTHLERTNKPVYGINTGSPLAWRFAGGANDHSGHRILWNPFVTLCWKPEPEERSSTHRGHLHSYKGQMMEALETYVRPSASLVLSFPI
ncbi:hypothetical protein FRB91_001496, partial [Serendipita sp. 411]